jgi:hypothetical protein
VRSKSFALALFVLMTTVLAAQSSVQSPMQAPIQIPRLGSAPGANSDNRDNEQRAKLERDIATARRNFSATLTACSNLPMS